jgi:hypothetical protein
VGKVAELHLVMCAQKVSRKTEENASVLLFRVAGAPTFKECMDILRPLLTGAP